MWETQTGGVMICMLQGEGSLSLWSPLLKYEIWQVTATQWDLKGFQKPEFFRSLSCLIRDRQGFSPTLGFLFSVRHLLNDFLPPFCLIPLSRTEVNPELCQTLLQVCFSVCLKSDSIVSYISWCSLYEIQTQAYVTTLLVIRLWLLIVVDLIAFQV